MSAPSSSPSSSLPLPPPVPVHEIDLYTLLGCAPSDAHVLETLRTIARSHAKGEDALLERQEKKYSDATYHIFPSLSLSYSFSPKTGLINQLDLTSPVPPASPSPSARQPPATSLPSEPFPLALAHALPWPLEVGTTLLDLLPVLGEPERKGGGLDNVGRLGPGVWVEWADVRWPAASAPASKGATDGQEEGGKKRGLYVEFEVRGQGCWERSALEGQRWKSCMLFDS